MFTMNILEMFVLAMAPSVITTVSFHNFCFSRNLENEFYASFTDK